MYSHITYKHYDAEEGECHTGVGTVHYSWRKTIPWSSSPPLISSEAEADKPHETPEAICNGINQNKNFLDLSNMNNTHAYVCIEGLELLVPGKHPLTSRCLASYAMEWTASRWIQLRLDPYSQIWQAPMQYPTHRVLGRGGWDSRGPCTSTVLLLLQD